MVMWEHRTSPSSTAAPYAPVGACLQAIPARAGKLLQLTLLLFFTITAHASDLTASVDRNQLSVEETFTLRLRYAGDDSSGGQPNFELLNQDFEILSRQQSTQYRVYNGRAESFVEWVITLAPKKEGNLFVPSLSYRGHISDAVPITVTEAGASPGGRDNSPAFIDVELDKERLHVQEQLLVKVRLYTTVGLHDIATEPLQVAGAHVEKIDEQRYERRINNLPHAVYELTYAVFPETSGTLQIPALNYVAVAGRRDPFSLFNRNDQRLRLRSQPQSVEVLPKPQSYSGEHWLPARSLGLVQSWSQDPETFKVGEPITRIITLRAEGLRAAQLPPLPQLNIEGLKTYPDQPQQEDQPGPGGITGSRIETTAIVATQPGEYTLPPITITWWDTSTGRQRATQLPAFRFSVAAAAGPITTAAGEAPQVTVAPTQNHSRFWQLVAIAALASHLLWMIYFWRRRSPAKPQSRTANQAQEVQALRDAAHACDPVQLNQALHSWLAARKVITSTETPDVEPEEAFKLRELINAALYQSPPRPLNRQQVQILLDRLLKQQNPVKHQIKNTALPDLFA